MIDDTPITPPDDTAEEPLSPTPAATQGIAAAEVDAEPETPEPTAPEQTAAPEPLSAAPAGLINAETTDTEPEDSAMPDIEAPHEEHADDTSEPSFTPPSLATQVTAPLPSAENAHMDAYWNSVLTGNPATVPAEVRSLAGADDDSLDIEEQNYRLLGTINRSWAVDHLGVSKEELQDGWKNCRAKLAKSLGVADDEQEVFMGLSVREEDKPRREAGRRIFEKAYLAGLKGETSCDTRPEHQQLDAADQQPALALEQEAYSQGAAVRRRWLPLAERVARGADAFVGLEEDFLSAPRVISAVPELAQAVDEVARLADEDRDTVLFLAADLTKRQRPTASAEGLGSRLVRAVRRGAGNIGMGVAQIANHAGIVTLANLGETLGGKTGQALEKAASAWDRRSTVLQRLRDITQQDVAPLYPAEAARRAESYLIDAAEATPAAMLAFCGGAGFAALAASGMGDSVAAARSLNPQGDHELQLAAGILGGAVQGAIYMGMGRLGGRLLEQSIGNFMKSRGAGIGTFSLNALKSAGSAALHGAELIAAGKISQATEMGAQELAARLSGTASHIDWKSFGDNLTDIETNMRQAAAILPFLLIGSGRVALRHFRSPHAVLGEGFALRDWGVDDATRTEIIQAPDIDTQGSMLREAIRGSRRWSAPGFMPEIVRAMQLFNGDYFKGFADIECVRDFLKLPAERSLLEDKVIQQRDATDEKVQNLEGHVLSRYMPDYLKSKDMFAEAMNFWDVMYQKSHVAEHTPRYYFGTLREGLESARDDRVDFYTDITRGIIPTIPFRMRNIGYYNPQGEAERRALMRDRAQECLDLSYQFVMSTYSIDSLLAHGFPMSRIATHLEITRNNVIGQMARAVLDMASGMKPSESMHKLSSYLGMHCVRRRYRGAPPKWLDITRTRDLKEMDKYLPQLVSVTDMHHPDFKNVLRVISGLNACAQTLVRLLPMTSDFQTALTRGMSPLQAYHHLLLRELGYNPKKVPGYPLKAIKASSNSTDMERFGEENRKTFDIAHRLTGLDLEQCQGEDGATYRRARRPDGGYTRWHAEEKDVINELGISMAPYFGEMGKGIHHWLYRAAAQDHFDLKEMPRASYRQFSGFDQLCSIATKDLGNFWHRSVTRTQPGFLPVKLRTMQTGSNMNTPLDAQAETKVAADAGVDVSVDRLSLITPATMINSRFRVFWERAFKSNLLSVPEAGEFLMQRGYLSPERYQKIIDLSKQLPYPKNRNTPLRLTPPPDIAGMHREMSKDMARFHALYYFAHIQQQNLPESVKAWFRMAPFCPDMPEEDCSTKSRIRFGYKGLTAISWANRYITKQLKQLAPDVEAMRHHVAEHPLPEGRIAELFHHATGESLPQRCEQSWCYHYSGPGVFRGTPQKDWNLMLAPMRTWELFSEEEKQDIRMRLGSFCREDPTQEALDAAGRGEEVDYAEYALRQLDRVLQRYPDLHRYAPVSDNSAVMRTLQLTDDPPAQDLNAEPETQPVPLRWLEDFDGAYTVKRLHTLPETLAEDAEALHSLRFLDTLRRIAIRRPYALGNGIWWDKKLYGGPLGLHPNGLEQWQAEEPLEPLFILLGNIDKCCRDSGEDTLSVCGVKLKGAQWSKQDFDELACSYVYRWPEDRARVYRLMPGYPDSPNIFVRSPYVVACHHGAYMNGNRAIRTTEELQHSFSPLESFRPSNLRYYNDLHLKQWRNHTMDSILDAIEDRPAYLAAVGNAESGVVGMGELLMRLCEDTGFCRSIDPSSPQNLTRQQAHIVNIASAIMACMQQRGSVPAMEQLRAAVAPLQTDPQLRHEVLRTLRDSCDKVKDDTRIHNNVLTQLEQNWDEVEEEQATMRSNNAADDATVDTSQLRQGELDFGDSH